MNFVKTVFPIQKLTLRFVKKEVERCAMIIAAPKNLLPTYRLSKDFGHPHIEIDKSGKLNYIKVERGKEFERRITVDLNELLFWIFESVTFSMASDFELKHRIKNQDFRKILFERQVYLLSLINEDWKLKREIGILKILSNHPYSDESFIKEK